VEGGRGERDGRFGKVARMERERAKVERMPLLSIPLPSSRALQGRRASQARHRGAARPASPNFTMTAPLPPSNAPAPAYAGQTECWACGATVRVPISAAGGGGAPAPAFYCGWCRAVNGTIPRAGRGRAGLGRAINA